MDETKRPLLIGSGLHQCQLAHESKRLGQVPNSPPPLHAPRRPHEPFLSQLSRAGNEHTRYDFHRRCPTVSVNVFVVDVLVASRFDQRVDSGSMSGKRQARRFTYLLPFLHAKIEGGRGSLGLHQAVRPTLYPLLGPTTAIHPFSTGAFRIAGHQSWKRAH